MRVKTNPRSMTDSRSLRKKARLVLSLSTSSRSWGGETQTSVKSWNLYTMKEETCCASSPNSRHRIHTGCCRQHSPWGACYSITWSLFTFWKRDTMSPAMVLTSAVMSSIKRSGKRFFLGDSKRSAKYRWWMMLFTCGVKHRILCCGVFH